MTERTAHKPVMVLHCGECNHVMWEGPQRHEVICQNRHCPQYRLLWSVAMSAMQEPTA